MMVLFVKHVHLQKEGGEAAETETERMSAQSASRRIVKRVMA